MISSVSRTVDGKTMTFKLGFGAMARLEGEVGKTFQDYLKSLETSGVTAVMSLLVHSANDGKGGDAGDISDFLDALLDALDHLTHMNRS